MKTQLESLVLVKETSRGAKNKAIEYLREQLPNYFVEFNHIYYPDADPIPFSPDPFITIISGICDKLKQKKL